MRLLPININPYNFKSNTRDVITTRHHGVKSSEWGAAQDDCSGKFLYSNYTYFYRGDLSCTSEEELGDWYSFRETLKNHFKNTPKVNTFNFACSDGSETYSLACALIDEFGENSEKFFPIQAFDIDSEIVTRAKSGLISCSKSDINRMQFNLKKETRELFTISKQPLPLDLRFRFLFNASDELRAKIDFSCDDIENQIESIPEKNNLIMCRNFWPYLGFEKSQRIIKKLGEKLDKSSLVVIGNYDKQVSYIEKYLMQAGFVQIGTNIYQKLV